MEFDNVRPISSLDVRPLSERDAKETLKRRGREFVRLQGKHFLEYHNGLLKKNQWGELLHLNAVGRVMVDCAAYRKMNKMGQVQDNSERKGLGDLSPDQMILCASTVLGYSFKRKEWGRFVVDEFSPIVWRKGAFDHLVLPGSTKELIRALVSADRQKGMTDVIAVKGGGCIIVLHGRPGTGKTLTAEAVAELQEKPLMSVSVGELGQDAGTVEKALEQILEMSSLWNSIILLDEADVFLEARSLREIHRNAMVGVLRLLEYHQQIMFLTTNRVTTVDEAFKSRISVAIRYKDLDKEARKAIWENFLGLIGVNMTENVPEKEMGPCITMEQLDNLASKDLNGREIKNTTRTAQTLAASLNQPLSYNLILQVIGIVEQFDQDFVERLQ